jgi:hypothetical protein
MGVEKLKPDSALRTNALAEALTQKGYPTAPATLATKRSRGGGPPYRRWGRIPIYTWGEALEWAQSRLGEPHCSTSEEDAASVRAPAKHFDAAGPVAAPAEQPTAEQMASSVRNQNSDLEQHAEA